MALYAPNDFRVGTVIVNPYDSTQLLTVTNTPIGEDWCCAIDHKKNEIWPRVFYDDIKQIRRPKLPRDLTHVMVRFGPPLKKIEDGLWGDNVKVRENVPLTVGTFKHHSGYSRLMPFVPKDVESKISD